jgi:hypothetical protein
MDIQSPRLSGQLNLIVKLDPQWLEHHKAEYTGAREYGRRAPPTASHPFLSRRTRHCRRDRIRGDSVALRYEVDEDEDTDSDEIGDGDIDNDD